MNYQPISYAEDIKNQEIDKGDQFLVLGSDGLFDKMASQEVCDFILNMISETNKNMEVSLTDIAERLAAYCINEKGVRDNVTVMIVGLTRFVCRDA